MPSSLTLTDQRTGRPPDVGSASESHWSLSAERRWIVAGPDAELRALQDALPATCVTRIGPVLQLHFGNVVGRFDVPGLGRLEVTSGKWSEADFDAMLEDVTRISSSLPFTAGESGGLPYDRTLIQREDVPYHAFVYLRHALTGRCPTRHPLLPGLRAILADPHRRRALSGWTWPARASGTRRS